MDIRPETRPDRAKDANGRPIDLKKYIGKSVVMLDFWATWCGPCVEAMPEVEEVAKQYASKGLVFYAVNAGEDVGAVKKFLQESKLNPPVAMDEKKEIGPMYAVRGIPQTVLIGKDGKVQVVHVGYNSRLPKLLAKEIDDLLVGKDLATETLSKAEAAKSESSNTEEQESPGADPQKARSVPVQQ